MTRDSLRNAIAVVAQVPLFQRSIMENIRYGAQNASDEMVYEAAAAARCDFIASLPHGPDILVSDPWRQAVRRPASAHRYRPRFSERRASCSSWTRPRRRSTANPKRQSAMPPGGSCADGRSVPVSHRLWTVPIFDRIVVLQEGRIIEDGSPDSLLRRDGCYRQLIRREMNRLVK